MRPLSVSLFLFFSLFLLPLALLAQGSEAHRGVIERDQQSAEFGARLRGDVQTLRRLESLHEQQRRELAHPVTPELRAYERERFARERRLLENLEEQDRRAEPRYSRPLPLPGGMPRGVDPVLPQGLGY